MSRGQKLQCILIYIIDILGSYLKKYFLFPKFLQKKKSVCAGRRVGRLNILQKQVPKRIQSVF